MTNCGNCRFFIKDKRIKDKSENVGICSDSHHNGILNVYPNWGNECEFHDWESLHIKAEYLKHDRTSSRISS